VETDSGKTPRVETDSGKTSRVRNGECEDTKIVETEYKQTVGRHQELGNRAGIRNKVRGNRQTLGIHSECRNRKTMGIKTPRA